MNQPPLLFVTIQLIQFFIEGLCALLDEIQQFIHEFIRRHAVFVHQPSFDGTDRCIGKKIQLKFAYILHIESMKIFL